METKRTKHIKDKDRNDSSTDEGMYIIMSHVIEGVKMVIEWGGGVKVDTRGN